MTRSELTLQILDARRRLGLSWTELADAIGRDRVWATAACLGQHPFDAESAQRLVDTLQLAGAPDRPGAPEILALLSEVPTRGSYSALPPSDPTVYRLYEVLQVYGPTLKELIHEDFGDGIMSAINFRLDVSRAERDGEARVQIVLDGKFLPYQW